MKSIIREKPNDPELDAVLGEEVEKEIVVFMDDAGVPVDKEVATQVRIVLYGKTQRLEEYGILKRPPSLPESPPKI